MRADAPPLVPVPKGEQSPVEHEQRSVGHQGPCEAPPQALPGRDEDSCGLRSHCSQSHREAPRNRWPAWARAGAAGRGGWHIWVVSSLTGLS